MVAHSVHFESTFHQNVASLRGKRSKYSVLDLRWMHVANLGPPGDAPNGNLIQSPLFLSFFLGRAAENFAYLSELFIFSQGKIF